MSLTSELLRFFNFINNNSVQPERRLSNGTFPMGYGSDTTIEEGARRFDNIMHELYNRPSITSSSNESYPLSSATSGSSTNTSVSYDMPHRNRRHRGRFNQPQFFQQGRVDFYAGADSDDEHIPIMLSPSRKNELRFEQPAPSLGRVNVPIILDETD